MTPKKYSHTCVVAGEYLCIPACLEIILRTYSYKLSQYDIAEYFEVNVNPTYEGPIRNVTYTTDPNMYGIVVKNGMINDFFLKFNLPFKEEYFPINQQQDWMFEELLNERLSLDKHLICGFSYGVLFGDDNKVEMGHVALVESVDSDSITIYDPGPLHPGIKQVDLYDMFSAIKRKNDGVWVIGKVTYDEQK